MPDLSHAVCDYVRPGHPEIRAVLVGALATALGWLVLGAVPGAEIELFARGAASLGGLLTGDPVVRDENGWLLAGAVRPVLVSSACSATGFFLTVVALLGWQLARRGIPAAIALTAALLGAVPVTLLVNALRVVAVAQMHRWVIPQLPEAYGPFLHMLTGVSVFLPSLIALNLLLERHGKSRSVLR